MNFKNIETVESWTDGDLASSIASPLLLVLLLSEARSSGNEQVGRRLGSVVSERTALTSRETLRLRISSLRLCVGLGAWGGGDAP